MVLGWAVPQPIISLRGCIIIPNQLFPLGNIPCGYESHPPPSPYNECHWFAIGLDAMVDVPTVLVWTSGGIKYYPTCISLHVHEVTSLIVGSILCFC